MSLNVQEWQDYQVSRILTIINGKGITKEEIDDNQGDFTVVQSGEENNGVLGKIDLNYCKQMGYTFTEKECLTVARSGSAGFVSFQVNGCVVGDSAKILLLDDDIATTSRYVFIRTILTLNRFKYAYGRKVTEEKYMNDIVKLPSLKNIDGTYVIDANKRFSDEGYIPDWEYMDEFISGLKHKPLTTTNKKQDVQDIDITEWKEFIYDEIFILKGGFYNKKPEHSAEGKVPFLGSTESNNGVTEYYSLDDIYQWDKVGGEDFTFDKKMYEGNCIAVTVNGSVCNAFYQKNQFTCSHDITAMYIKEKELTPYIAIFLATIIMKEKYRWSYGRKPHDVKKFGKSIMKLPVLHNEDGTVYIDPNKTFSKFGYVPDWDYMENYIRQLPYADKMPV